MCTPESLRGLFEQSKLEDLSVGALKIVTCFTNFDDYWNPLLTGQGSAPNYLATRDKKVQAAIRERLRAALPTTPDGKIEMPALAWAIRGRRP
jgi:hypothetical protein